MIVAQPDPYAPPGAALRDTAEDGVAARRRMICWGVAAVILLGLAALVMLQLIFAAEQIFESFGADLPAAARTVMDLRAAWFLLPLAALLLTIGGARRPVPMFAPARVTRWLIGLIIASLFLCGFGWYVMYLPISRIGARV